MDKLGSIYVAKIVHLHIVLVSKFQTSLQNALGMRLNFSTVFHPQTDGQLEHTIQTLENMLQAHVMEFKGGVGTFIYLCQSLLTITVIKLVSRWHHMRLCIVENAEFQYTRIKLVSGGYLVQNQFRIPTRRYNLLVID